MFALMIGAVSANAQIATQNSNALDNISAGITVGASTPLDFNSIFPLNTNVGVKFEKDFTTMFGVQLEGLAILNDNHFSNVKTLVKATNVGVNGIFNLTNIFKGYTGAPRFFEVSTVTGIGWLHTWTTSHNFLTAKTGLDLAFNLGKSKANSIVVTPAIYWNLNKLGDVKFNKHMSQLAVNVSFIHHFKNSNGTHHFKTWDVGAMQNEIVGLQAALNECRTHQHSDTIVKVEKVKEKTIIVKNGATQWIVAFEQGSDVLTDEAKFILNQIGQNIVVDVVATASPDGPEAFNQTLSEKRAKKVADFLTDNGVKVNSAVGKGEDETSGRTAVVTPTTR